MRDWSVLQLFFFFNERHPVLVSWRTAEDGPGEKRRDLSGAEIFGRDGLARLGQEPRDAIRLGRKAIDFSIMPSLSA